MHRTESQLAASRRNGANSRGPATAAGKAKSALNATKHGLWSRDIVLATEDPRAWEAFREGLLRELAPATPAARELVEELAAARWRLDRVLNIETALINGEIERLRAAGEQEGPNLLAGAYRNLHDAGVLRHVHRQQARLRRIVDQLTQEWAALTPEPEQYVSVPPRLPEMCRNEPEIRLPRPEKRPTYDKNGRRIHYPDLPLAA